MNTHYWFYGSSHKDLSMQSSGGVWRLLCCLLLSCFLGRAGGRPHLGQGERGVWLEAVKKGILESLGMERPPVSLKKPQQDELKKMYRLYEAELQQLRLNRSRFGATRSSVKRASTVLISAQVDSVGADPQRFRAVFHKTNVIRKELTLVHAQLKLYGQFLNKPWSNQSEFQQEVLIKVHQDFNMTYQDPLKKDGFLLTNILDSSTLTVDVQPIVEDWTSSSEERLVLEVSFVKGLKTHSQDAPEIVLEMEMTKPVLKERRTRRRAPIKEDCEEDKCCRKSLNVSFKDIGWSDWVVAPEGYTMYFCDGSCPLNYRPASMHTQVKSRLHRITKGATPRPCCVPAAYEPMVIMHYDSQGKLTFSAFDDMIVSSCYCA